MTFIEWWKQHRWDMNVDRVAAQTIWEAAQEQSLKSMADEGPREFVAKGIKITERQLQRNLKELS